MTTKRILTADENQIPTTNKAMQGIIYIENRTKKEFIYLTEIGGDTILGPNSTKGAIKRISPKDLKKKYKVTTRRNSPSDKLWE